MLAETAKGAPIAIVLGNILGTIILGCPVIGAKFTDFGNWSLTPTTGMFLGGRGERLHADQGQLTAARDLLACGRPCCSPGSSPLPSEKPSSAARCTGSGLRQALAGGAVLALVAHAMTPVALEEGGLLVALPTVAGFLFAL